MPITVSVSVVSVMLQPIGITSCGTIKLYLILSYYKLVEYTIKILKICRHKRSISLIKIVMMLPVIDTHSTTNSKTDRSN